MTLFLIRYVRMRSISRNDHWVDRANLALPSAYQESGDTEIDDVTCGTKSMTTQDVIGTTLR